MALTEAQKRAQKRYGQKFRNVSMRLTQEQYEKLHADAAAAGLSVAQYIKAKVGI